MPTKTSTHETKLKKGETMDPPFIRTIKHCLKLLGYRSKGWQFSALRRNMFLDDADEWNKHYLPINMKGLTVLDVGAGEGETARFYLEHGAKKVLCIEPDKTCFKKLKENAIGKPIKCYNERFSLDDLKLPFDFMKMDIEGYEEELLGTPNEKPCVIELHGLPLRDKFKKAGYKIRDKDWTDWLSYAYKNI